MRRIRPAIAIVSVCFIAGPATAADIDATVQGCNDCHGENGVSQWDDMPTIGGMDAFTHADALYVYRDQERTCAESAYRLGNTDRVPTTMCETTASLSDDEIEGIAEHYAGLTFAPAVQEFDAALAATGAAIHKRECDRCHSDGGANAEDEAGILAGQWMGYLRESFDQYAADERPQDKKMREKMENLSADDVEALVHYYASQQ